MSQPRVVNLRKRKSPAEDTRLAEKAPRESKRARICMRAVVEALSEWRIDATRVVSSEIVAPKSGRSADIAKATIINSKPKNTGYRGKGAVLGVAVKKFRFDDDGASERVQAGTFANELILLSELRHENVIQLLGFVESVEGGIAWIILPWEANGNLREFVLSGSWAIPERLSLIHDVACGVDYLHSRDPPIYHADLKSLNILVNSDNHAVITDFGSARRIGATWKCETRAQDTSLNPLLSTQCCTTRNRVWPWVKLDECATVATLTTPAYTLRWAAPEILEDEKFGLASDMWAFGWACWEIMTGDIPFDDVRGDVDVVHRVTRGDLPVVASNEHIAQVDTLCIMMTQCWAMDPTKRPAARECKRRLSRMSKIAPAKRNTDTPDQSHIAQAFYTLGYTKHANGETEEAAALFLRALNIAVSSGNRVSAAAAALGLGSVNASQGNCADAGERYRYARRIFNEVGYQVGVAHAIWGQGEIFRLQENYQEAENSYTEAMEIYTQAGDQPGVASAHLGLGDTYRLRDRHSAAEWSYLAAKRIYAQFEDHPGVAHAAWALGEVYRCQADFVKAEASYVEAKRIYGPRNDRSGVANTTWGLGELYRLRDQWASAEASYVKAREIYTRLDDWKGVVDAEWGLGEVYRRQGEYGKAKTSYTEAREISTRIGYEWGATSALCSGVKMEGWKDLTV